MAIVNFNVVFDVLEAKGFYIWYEIVSLLIHGISLYGIQIV